MTVVEISECFPNNFKPVRGEFILQHVKALSKHCSVITLVPLRFIPSREILSYNPFKLASNFFNWISKLMSTKKLAEKNLNVIYFGYISFPRPYFEVIDTKFLNIFFYQKLKKILTNNNPDIIYCNWFRPWGLMAERLAKEFNIPFIIDHHEDIPTLKKLFPNSYKHFLKIFDCADCTIVHSTANKKDLINELESEKLNLKKIETIYLGQNFSSSMKSEFNDKKIKLVCVSHLSEPRKNIEVLIEAVSILKSRREIGLIIIGDGVLKARYQKLSKELSLDNEIKFTGEKSRGEVSALLDEADIFVLPSYPEAFGIVFIEALAKGLPVITCKENGGGEELKLLGYPISLVNPNSSEDLADAILNLSVDKAKMNSMSEIGKQLVREHFTWERNASATFNLLKDIIKKFKTDNHVRH